MNTQWAIIRCYLKYEELKMNLINRKAKSVVNIHSDNLLFGDKINSALFDVDWFVIPTHGIRWRQFIHGYKAWKDSHTVTFVGDGHGKFEEDYIFEWTFPTARFTPFNEWYQPEEKAYNVNRYADAIPTIEAEELILSFFDEMDGTIYDVPSLLNFIILDILGYDETDYKPILDLGKKNLVCSVGARAADMLWYNEFLKETQCRRPGGEIHVERTYPALFPDHETYLHII